jgi:hypothetical protein
MPALYQEFRRDFGVRNGVYSGRRILMVHANSAVVTPATGCDTSASLNKIEELGSTPHTLARAVSELEEALGERYRNAICGGRIGGINLLRAARERRVGSCKTSCPRRQAMVQYQYRQLGALAALGIRDFIFLERLLWSFRNEG